MRTVGAGQSAQPGNVEPRVWVADSTGTFINHSASVVSVDYEDPSTDTPIAPATIVFKRGAGASSLAPLMTANPPLDVKRAVYIEVPVGGGAYKEVFRGKVDRTDWKERFGHVTVEGRDQAGDVADAFIETLREYGSDDGVTLELVMQAVADDNVTNPPSLYFPTATSAAVQPAYEQQQEGTFQALRTLAESIGWTLKYRYIDASSAWRLSVFEPARTKTVADHTFGAADYWDVSEMNVDVEFIRNVVAVEYSDSDDARQTVTVEDLTSISKYGRRYMKISEGSDSPIRDVTTATALANAALSDLSEPDATLEITAPYFWPGECGVDLYAFTANEKHFSSDQKLAPVAIRHRLAVGERATSRIQVRGKPSGGRHTWNRRTTSTVTEPESVYSLIDFKPIQGAASGFQRYGWTRGAKIQAANGGEVWAAYKVFDSPFSADYWNEFAALVDPLADDRDYIDIPLPLADEVTLLQVEPRYSAAGGMKVHPSAQIWRVQLDYVPPKSNGWIDARVTAGLVDIYAGANPTDSALPIAWEIRSDTQAGTLLASGSFTTAALANAGVGPADDSDLADIQPPASGRKTWWAKFTDTAGNVEWVQDSVGAPNVPKIRVRQTAGGTVYQTDIHVTIQDPDNLGGTLTAWLNRSSTTDADPAGAADGTRTVASTPVEIGPLDTAWSTATALLNDVWVYPGRGKWVYFQYVNSAGISSEPVGFQLKNWLDIVDEDGALGDDKISRPASFAASLRPPKIITSLATAGDFVGQIGFLNASGAKTYYEWDGAAWNATSVTPQYGYFATIEAGAIGADEVAAVSMTAAKFNVAKAFVQGVTWTDNSPVAGSIAWSTGRLIYKGTNHSISSGSTAEEIVWWDFTTPTAFQGTDQATFDTYTTDGTFNPDEDVIIAFNRSGSAIETWNGTMIAGGMIITDTVAADKIKLTELSELTPDAGIVVSGILQNAASSPTAAIRISSGDTMPATATRWLDLAATGSGAVLRHEELSLNADGTANWSDDVINQPALTQADAEAVWDSANTESDFSVTWSNNSLVTSSHSIEIQYYHNGTLIDVETGIAYNATRPHLHTVDNLDGAASGGTVSVIVVLYNTSLGTSLSSIATRERIQAAG